MSRSDHDRITVSGGEADKRLALWREVVRMTPDRFLIRANLP
jgi:hypothetical protein